MGEKAERKRGMMNVKLESARQYIRRFRVPKGTMLLVSGTASLDGNGRFARGDIQVQTWQTFRNVSALLEKEGGTWDHVVRTTCHLRDLERDYEGFKRVRNRFYSEIGLNAHPANTGIQGSIHRKDLLVEIEVMALLPHESSS